MTPKLLFRWIVFVLAAGFCIRTVLYASYAEFAGPFRYLTVWALFFSFFCASRMVAIMEERSDRRWDSFVSMTAVINAMVVFLYWKLFFTDPLMVNREGQITSYVMEFYLHGVGPALQIIDAVFVHRAFRRPLQALMLLVGVIALYTLWMEGVLQAVNTLPFGTVTSGLPYPFLNDLTVMERGIFYVGHIAAAAGLLLTFALIARRVRRSAASTTTATVANVAHP